MNRIVLVLMVLCSISSCWTQSSRIATRSESEYYVAAYGQHYRVPPPFVRAVVERESNWRVCVVSPRGAVGLMQLMPATAQRLRVRDRCNADQNISGGVRYLAWRTAIPMSSGMCRESGRLTFAKSRQSKFTKPR